MRQQSKRHFDIDDNCKIFLCNLGLVSDRYLLSFLHGHGWSFPIPPKLVPKGDLVMALRASGTVLCRRPSFWDGDGVEVVGERAIVLARRGSGYRGYGDCRARNSGSTSCEVVGGNLQFFMFLGVPIHKPCLSTGIGFPWHWCLMGVPPKCEVNYFGMYRAAGGRAACRGELGREMGDPAWQGASREPCGVGVVRGPRCDPSAAKSGRAAP